MNPLDQALSFEDLKRFLIKVGLAVLAISYFAGSQLEMIGAMGGYVLFTVNIYFLAYLAKLVFTLISNTSEAGSNPKGKSGVVGLMIVAKFVFLAVALYSMIVVFKLPGLPIFLGSLVSVFSISLYLAVRYMEFLANSSLKHK